MKKLNFLVLLYFFMVLPTAHAAFEFHAKLDFGNRFGTTWNPLYGGQLGIEFILLRYFGLELGLKANSFIANEASNVRLTNFGPRLAPTFQLPFDAGSLSLVPYVMAAVDFPFLSIVDNKFGMGFGIEGGVGLKLIVGKIGGLIEWGAEYIKRTTAPELVFIPHRISAGLIVKF